MMDTQIFSLNLSVTGTSAYILLCSLAGDGRRPSLAVLYEAWVGSQEDLEPALKELLAWKVTSV
jgi:hypothetical protein